MLRPFFLLLLSILLFSTTSIQPLMAQTDTTEVYGPAQKRSSTNVQKKNPLAGLPLRQRLQFGGDFGLSFGSVTYIRIAPLVGYRVSPKFTVGMGPSYQYWKDDRYTPAISSTIWGLNTFARYFPLENIFLQSDFEILNLEEVAFDFTNPEYQRQRVTIPVWFVGGGYSQRTNSGGGFFIGVFYDLIQDINSPYPDNVAIRVGAFF